MQHKLRSILTVIGISLGVGVCVAVRNASLSTERAMQEFLETVSFGSDIHIQSGGKAFSEKYYSELHFIDGVREIHAFVHKKTRCVIRGKEYPVFALGYDILKEIKTQRFTLKNAFELEKLLNTPNQVSVSERFLRVHGLTQNDSIQIHTAKGLIECTIARVMQDKEYQDTARMVFFDIVAAQYYFHASGLIDRLDVTFDKHADPKVVTQRLQDALGKDFQMSAAHETLKHSDTVYRSFRLNLIIVSFLSLLVGIYFVWNTMNSFVMQRRQEIGIVCALGIRKREIFRVFMFKGIFFGSIGAFGGLFLAWSLNYVSTRIFLEQIPGSYFLSEYQAESFSLELCMLSAVISIGMSVTATISPALNALKVTVVDNIHRKTLFTIKDIRRYAVFGCISLTFALVCSRFGHLLNAPGLGFIANLMIVCGISLASPYVIRLILELCVSRVSRMLGIEMRVACESILRFFTRNLLTINTLMISFTLVINIMILRTSYYATLSQWLESVNNADVSIVSGFEEGNIFPMHEDRVDSLRKLSFIRDIDYYRLYYTNYNHDRLDIHSFDVHVANKYSRYTFVQGTQKEAFKLMKERDAVLISKDLAQKYSLSRGQYIKLQTSSGFRGFYIAGVVVNYLSSHGVLSMHRESFQRYWDDRYVDVFKVYLTKRVPMHEIYGVFSKYLQGSESLRYVSFQGLKNAFLGKLDRTFYAFHVLEYITVLIAFLGLSTTLLTSLSDKTKEIAILKVFAEKKRIRRILQDESFILVSFGIVLALFAGFLTSFITVFIINQHMFGWYLEYSVPFWGLVLLCCGALCASYVFAYYPAYKACNISIVKALQHE